MHTVRHILGRYPHNCQPAQVEPLGSAGGMSGAAFWRLTTLRGTLVLRRWPMEHPTPDRLRFIHAVLKHADRHDLAFLPVPIATSDGETFVPHAGHLWELAPWLPGAADYERSPRREKLRAALTALARFHLATADFSFPPNAVRVGRHAESLRQNAPLTLPGPGPAPAITRHLERLCALTPTTIADLSRAITDTIWPELVPLARQFLATLPRIVPCALAQLEPLANVPLPLQPCIRDIWHDHVLFTDERVTGLIDFGATDIDTPATDIVRLLASLGSVRLSCEQQTDHLPPSRHRYAQAAKRGLSSAYLDEARTWSEGLAAYATIRPLSKQEIQAARALDTSAPLLAGCNWIRWIYIDGRRFENREQVTRRFRRIVVRTQRLE